MGLFRRLPTSKIRRLVVSVEDDLRGVLLVSMYSCGLTLMSKLPVLEARSSSLPPERWLKDQLGSKVPARAVSGWMGIAMGAGRGVLVSAEHRDGSSRIPRSAARSESLPHWWWVIV